MNACKIILRKTKIIAFIESIINLTNMLETVDQQL